MTRLLSILLLVCSAGFAQIQNIPGTEAVGVSRQKIVDNFNYLNTGRAVATIGTVMPETCAYSAAGPVVLFVNSTGPALSVCSAPNVWTQVLGGGSMTWGQILGTLSSQADLTAALAGKAALNHASRHQNSGADEIATPTAGANAIPKAGADGTLAAGWIPDLSGTYARVADKTGAGSKIASAASVPPDGCANWSSGNLGSTGSACGTGTNGITDVVQDLTPSLGGDMDMNGHNIQTVTPTEMTYLHGVTSAIQTQLGGKVASTDPRLTDARTPTVHATSHQNGGSDEIATATAAANSIPKAGAGAKLDIGWIPTGSTSTTVPLGNDARFTDARAPTTHAASHASAGTDALTLAESQVTNLTTHLNAKEATANKDTNGGYVGRDTSGNATVPGTVTGSKFASSDSTHTGKVELKPGTSANLAETVADGNCGVFLDSANGNKMTRRCNSGGVFTDIVMEGGSPDWSAVQNKPTTFAPVAPGAATLGGVKSGQCTTTTQKLMGYDTSGTQICETDQTGSGGSWVTVPSSPDATGTAGQISADATYFYAAIATNTWKRVAWDSTWRPQIASVTLDNDTTTYYNDTPVTPASITVGATFCYTTDGSTPGASTAGTCDSSPTQTFSTPVSVTATATSLKFIGTKAGYSNSAVKSATYTLQVATPTATPGAGAVSNPTTVNFSTTTTGTVTFHYTTGDGTQAAPTCSTGTTGSSYSVTGATTLKVVGCKSNYADSGVLTAAYTVTSSGITAVTGAETYQQGNGGNTTITATPINTTGANACMLAVSGYSTNLATGAAITDSSDGVNFTNGTVWSTIPDSLTGSARTAIFYAIGSNLHTAASHTFKATTGTGNTYLSVAVKCWSGVGGLDGSVHHRAYVGTNTVAPGSITPTNNNELVVLACADTMASIQDSVTGFTKSENVAFSSSHAIALWFGYQLQTTKTAVNPSCNSTGASTAMGAVQAAFTAQ